jgi:hypothetical protein
MAKSLLIFYFFPFFGVQALNNGYPVNTAIVVLEGDPDIVVFSFSAMSSFCQLLYFKKSSVFPDGSRDR